MGMTSVASRRGRLAGAERDAAADGRMVAAVATGGQLLGIPIDRISEVFEPDRVTRVPLAPPYCVGLVNLRGRIVPIVSMRRLLSLPDDNGLEGHGVCVNVVQGEETIGLQVDLVDEIVTIRPGDVEPCPATMPQRLRQVSGGIVKLNNALMLLIDLDILLDWARGDGRPALARSA